MSPHTIVYLDQNYLSNIAKARHGCMKDEGEATFWRSLFDDLKKADWLIKRKGSCETPELKLRQSDN